MTEQPGPGPDSAANPLQHIRVLELSHYVAAPTAGMIFTELGAEVIKIEPLEGDPTRISKSNAVFYTLNRNKSSVAIDLKRAEGRDILLRLASGADVLLDNFVPGTLDRLGLGYDVLKAKNPGLIYAEIRGFLPGPNGDRPLMDEAAQVMAGLAYMTGPPGQPMRTGASVSDIGAGMWCVLAIMRALLSRGATGLGQRIDVGLFETAVFWTAHAIGQASLSGRAPLPMPSVGMGQQLTLTIYRLFRTSDDRWTFVAVVSDVQWQRLCAEFQLDDLWQDLSLRERRQRSLRTTEIEARFEEITARMTEGELAERLERYRIPFAPLNTPLDVLSDPHLNAIGGLIDVPLASNGAQSSDHIRVPGLPIRGSRMERRQPVAPPELGEHTRTVLGAAGVAEAEIDALAAAGVIRLGGA